MDGMVGKEDPGGVGIGPPEEGSRGAISGDISVEKEEDSRGGSSALHIENKADMAAMSIQKDTMMNDGNNDHKPAGEKERVVQKVSVWRGGGGGANYN